MATASVLILGSGWLGLPLARALAAAAGDAVVSATFRRPETESALRAAGVRPVPLDLPRLTAAATTELADATALVVALPPRGRQLGEAATDNYLRQLEPLAPYLASTFTVFTSSTGVYGKQVTGTVDERTPVSPDTASARAVVAAETWLSANCPNLAVLRLAGLVGTDRDPANFFRQRSTVPAALAPVNLVHRDDVVAAIQLILAARRGGIFNVCAAAHPTRQQFYGGRMPAATVAAIDWEPSGADGKRVDSTRLRRELEWQPRFDALAF